MAGPQTRGRRSARVCPRRGRRLALRCHRQSQSEKDKERADGAIEECGHGRTFAEPRSKRAREPRQNQTPDRSRRDEGKPENDKRDCLRRGVAIDELREKREEKERDLRIQNVGHDSLTKGRRGAAPLEMSGHRQLVLSFEERADAKK